MMREAKKRFLAAAAGTGIMAAVFAGTAWAEETRTEITIIKIRAVYNSSNKGSWVESDSIYIDEDVLAAIQSGNYNSYYGTVSSGNTPGSTYNGSGGWQQDGIGWWYRNADGRCHADGCLYAGRVLCECRWNMGIVENPLLRGRQKAGAESPGLL